MYYTLNEFYSFPHLCWHKSGIYVWEWLLRLGDYGWRKIKLKQVDFFGGGGGSLSKVSAFSVLVKD